jgi:hypothetical protein
MKMYENSDRVMEAEYHLKNTENWKKLTNFFVFLILMLSSFTVSAQTVHNLNSATEAVSLRSEDNLLQKILYKEAKAIRAFEINPALQSAKSVKIGDIVTLQFFENKSYKAKISDIATNIDGNFTLSLKLPDYSMAFGFITTNREGHSLLFVSIPELNQKFASRNSVNFAANFLIEIKDEARIKSKSDYKEIPSGIPVVNNNEKESQIPQNNNTIQKSPNAVSCTRDQNLTGTTPATINLLIVYTPAAAAWAAENEGGIANTIAGAMSQTKAVLDNQRNGDAIKLVYSGQISYIEHKDDMNTDLNNLTGTTDGFMDEVHQLRKQYNADVVTLLTNADDNGGLGWLLGNDDRGNYNYAFNVVRVQQASWTTTVIHETGHNLGMGHNVENSSGTQLYPYAFG